MRLFSSLRLMEHNKVNKANRDDVKTEIKPKKNDIYILRRKHVKIGEIELNRNIFSPSSFHRFSRTQSPVFPDGLHYFSVPNHFFWISLTSPPSLHIAYMAESAREIECVPSLSSAGDLHIHFIRALE